MTIDSTPPNASAFVLASSTVVAAEPLDESENSVAEGGDVVDMPVILLTDLDEDLGTVKRSDVSAYFRSSVPVAESIVTSLHDIDVEGGMSTRNVNYSETRAEFISVSFFKAHPGIPLGINLMRDELRIGSLTEGSIAQDSPLRAGDKILSVNHKDCETAKLNSVAVANILAESSGDVILVVHNEWGVSNLVECMIMKSEPSENVGISLGEHANSWAITITKIANGSKFSASLLNIGDIVLGVNEVTITNLNAFATAQIMKNSPQKVTILARTLQETGAVLAQLSQRCVASSNLPVIIGTTNSRPGQQGDGTLSTSNENFERKKIMSWLLIGAFIIGFIFWLVSIRREQQPSNLHGHLLL